jgi:hypothetical protein
MPAPAAVVGVATPIDQPAVMLAGALPAPTINIVFHDNGVSAAMGGALESLYQNLYSSLPHLQAFGQSRSVHAYTCSEDGHLCTILLFQLCSRHVVVLNHVIYLGAREIQRFAGALFERYPRVSMISFHTIETGLQQLQYPFYRYNVSENVILALPASTEAYLATLGKNTRKNMRYYLNRVKSHFPSFQYVLREREQVDDAEVLAILALKYGPGERSKHPNATTPSARATLELVRQRGMVGMIYIDGRLCAGSVGYRIGGNSFGGVLAHDPQFDDYSVGMLCCVLTVCEAITLGCREYHFLWGRDPFKFRLRGELHALDDVQVYRDRRSRLLHLPMIFSAVIRDYRRRLVLYAGDGGIRAFLLRPWRAARECLRRLTGKT